MFGSFIVLIPFLVQHLPRVQIASSIQYDFGTVSTDTAECCAAGDRRGTGLCGGSWRVARPLPCHGTRCRLSPVDLSTYGVRTVPPSVCDLGKEGRLASSGNKEWMTVSWLVSSWVSTSSQLYRVTSARIPHSQFVYASMKYKPLDHTFVWLADTWR